MFRWNIWHRLWWGCAHYNRDRHCAMHHKATYMGTSNRLVCALCSGNACKIIIQIFGLRNCLGKFWFSNWERIFNFNVDWLRRFCWRDKLITMMNLLLFVWLIIYEEARFTYKIFKFNNVTFSGNKFGVLF